MIVKAHRGDAKTLLAWSLLKSRTKDLAGFTIKCAPPGRASYYLENSLSFEYPEQHAQDYTELPTATINAPLHKFRWIHVPGSLHQGTKPVYGTYRYTITPRYLDGRSLKPIDTSLGESIEVKVAPFKSSLLELGFTRGFVQSQAYVHHFGPKAEIQPHERALLFDTAETAGENGKGEPYSYGDEYEWLGFTARQKLFALVDEVVADRNLALDMFAYDLNEPYLLERLLTLAKQGRLRLILDNAGLHHSTSKPKLEDQFEKLFREAAKAPAEIKRGKFGRYAHDKVLVVSGRSGPRRVLTGSTNFSVTGLYVNSNHVLIFQQREIARKYAELFQAAWDGDVQRAAYLETPLAGETFQPAKLPVSISFAPHEGGFATEVLESIAARVDREAKRRRGAPSVMFAVMSTDSGKSPVYTALNAMHRSEDVFSLGISDDPDGIALYSPGRKTGLLVTGKPVGTQLPAPFSQVPGVGSGHQIHHKFVVCGFNTDDAVVYCGSSNLALGGEQLNGDNLLEIRDPEVVTAFGIEAIALVDHFQFLNCLASGSKAKTARPPPSKKEAAAAAHWFLGTTDAWKDPYFDPGDLHYLDRRFFT